MFDDHAVAAAVVIDQGEPVRNALVQFDVFTERDERVAGQGDALFLSLVDHQFHVGKDAADFLSVRHGVALAPELLGCLPDGLDEAELLHVSRRQGPVKVVDQRYSRFFLHNLQRYIKICHAGLDLLVMPGLTFSSCRA